MFMMVKKKAAWIEGDRIEFEGFRLIKKALLANEENRGAAEHPK